MATTAVPRKAEPTHPVGKRGHRSGKKWSRLQVILAWVAGVLVVLAVPGVILANKYWPYRYRNVKPLLESVLASKIEVKAYHRTYFPRPGFVATGLVMHRDSGAGLPPVGTAQDLIVQGSWLDLVTLRDRVQLVEVRGLHVVIPPVGSDANKADFPAGSSNDFAGPDMMVQRFHMINATLEIQRVGGGSYVYPISDLDIRNLQKNHAITYKVAMEDAMPSGHIASSGSFGPVLPTNLGNTALNGDFVFEPVKLSDLGKLQGTLSTKGHFDGTLASICGKVTADVPDFAVSTGRPTAISGSAQLTINGLNGDVVMNTVEVKTGATTVSVKGSVTGDHKVTNADIEVRQGRAQDLLRPFLTQRSPVVGAVSLRGHVVVSAAQGKETFLNRLRVDGSFDVPAEKLTDRNSQQQLASFSSRAQGAKADAEDEAAADAMSSVKGPATIRNGIISSSNLVFEVPGASANLNGTYNLWNDQVHLVGHISMQTDISHVTTGWKSMMLKPLAPFFKKKPAGAVFPIAVTGGPGNYKIGQDFLHDK